MTQENELLRAVDDTAYLEHMVKHYEKYPVPEIRAHYNRLMHIANRLRSQGTRIAELEAEATTFAKQAASEKLRADQMTEQHRMQAKMHSEAS